jgi:Sulfotransferase family
LNSVATPSSVVVAGRPSAAQLTEEALGRVALESHDVQGVRPGLEALADSLVREAGLTSEGFQRAREGIDDSLRRLAAIRADRRLHPEIERVQIAPQVFILGMPRCGTSILHALLAADPQFRAPLMWEVAAPSPPPEAATFGTDPRAAAFDDYVRAAFAGEWQDVLKAHPIGARVPQECGMMLETAFCSANPAMLFRVPSFFEWFLHTDTSYGYEVHRAWLQHLQWHNPRERWVLKVQEHMYHMPELVAAYPQAVVVQPHRDPVTVIASISRLIQVIRSNSFAVQDSAALGREMLQLWNHGLVRSMEYRAAHPELKVYDLSYRELAADPVKAVRGIYGHFGVEFRPESESGIRRWLAENPADKHGRHTYKLEDYGLTQRDVKDVYGPYMEAYRDYM